MSLHKWVIKYRKLEKLIRRTYLNTNNQIKSFISTRQIWRKLIDLSLKILEIGFTGILIHYAYEYHNWMATGLKVAFATYYVEWLIKLMKRKET